MRTAVDTSSSPLHAGTSVHAAGASLNAAQRLRRMLGLDAARGGRPAPRRGRNLHIEALEPRYLLSGEGLVLPPLPEREQLTEPTISVPSDLLGQQVLAGLTQAQAVHGAATLSQQTQADEVIFVDPSVAGHEGLIREALLKRDGPGAPAVQVELVVLDGERDGIEQISAWLSQRQGLAAVHLISHGDDARLILGSTTLDAHALETRAGALASWGAALAAGADLLIYGCDVGAGESGAAFVSRLAALTGADVAASTNATGAAAQGGDWLLERASGGIQAGALSAQGYAGLLALDASTLTLNAGLRTQMLEVLEKIDEVATLALENGVVNAELPGLEESVNSHIGLTNGPDDPVVLFQLEDAADDYFTVNGDASTLQGLASVLQAALLAELPSGGGRSWAATVTASLDPSAPEVVAGLRIQIGLNGSGGWTQTGLEFTGGTLNGWQGSATAKMNLDIQAGLVLSDVTAATSNPGTIQTPSNTESFFRFDDFELSLELTPTDTNRFHLLAGIDADLADADNSDERSRITLTDYASSGGNPEDVLQLTMTAIIDGASNSSGTGTGYFGEVVAGELTLKTYSDVALNGTANGLVGALAGAKKLGAQVDVLEQFGINMPLADASMTALLRTADGRTLGDVLSFRTPDNTTVVDDYLADGTVATKTLSGLLQRLREYFTGTGNYASLEALVAASYVNDFMRIGATTGAGSSVKLNLNLELSRDFMRRFTFNDKLLALGVDFAPGSAVALRSTVNLGLDYDTFTSESVEVTHLDARVYRPDTAFNAQVAVGLLEGTASGTLAFDTGTVNLRFGFASSTVAYNVLGIDVTHGQAGTSVQSLPSQLSPGAISDPNDDNYRSDLWGNIVVSGGQPQASAAASFTITGVIGAGTAGATSFSTLEGGTPTISLSFNSGSPVEWSKIKAKPVTMTASNFTNLQAFASLDAAALVRMLTDLGTYLTMLRESGEFDALLPFTNLQTGDVLDFAGAFNRVVASDLQYVLSSGVTAARAVSPVLSQDVSFDLQLTRPGDTQVTLVTIGILASETSAFTHIDQLAQLIDGKIAAAMNGTLRWMAESATATGVVTREVAGGIVINSALTTSEEQRVDLRAGNGTFRLRLGSSGPQTVSLALNASLAEVQAALESLSGIGDGNVLVTGSPKHYVISFTGDLAGQAQDLLEVTLSDSSSSNAGGLIDVTATNTLTGDDGRVWGQLNILQSIPGTFEDLRVSATAGVAVQNVTTGTAEVDAVQRITIVHAGGGSFVLKGIKLDGTTEFTTSAISLDGAGTWSDRIRDALNAALSTTTVLGVPIPLTEAQGVTVTPTDPETIATMAGVQVFDITFSGSSVSKRAIGTLAADGTQMRAKPEAQFSLYTLTRPALAVGATPAQNEVQRFSLANAASGNVVFGVTIGNRFFEAEPLSIAGMGAAQIQSTLVAMFQQWDTSFGASDVVVTAATGKSNTWDIEFRGRFAGVDAPELRIDITGITAQASASAGGFALLDRLGFTIGGQDQQTTNVTSFVSFNDMLERFQQAVNESLAGTGASFSVAPQYDNATRSLSFKIRLAPLATTQATPLVLTSDLGELSALSASAALEITSATAFETTIGFDLRSLNTFALRAGGTTTTVIAAGGGTQGPIKLAIDVLGVPVPQTADFRLLFDGEEYALSFNGSTTLDNTTHAHLVSDMQAVLDARNVVTGGVLASKGYTTVGQAVKAALDGKNYLRLISTAPVGEVQMRIDSASNPASSILGFQPMTMYPGPKPVTLPANGRLIAGDANLRVSLDQSASVLVTLAKTATDANTTLNDLIADLNAAFAATSVSAHPYLGTGAGGKGFTHMGQIIQASIYNNQIQLITQTHAIASMQLDILGADPATTELGFTPGQFARTSGAEVYLQDASVDARFSAQVHGQNGATPATLATQGNATLGMLDIVFSQLHADYQGRMSFDLRNGVDGLAGDRISLNALFDSVNSQESQLGMGGAISTSDTATFTQFPVRATGVADGRLIRDVGLSVTVGTLALDVMVRASDTSTNASIADLAADVDAAIHDAIVAELGSDPYAGHVFVREASGDDAGKLEIVAATTTLSLATTPQQIYDSATGRLLVDLPVTVTKGTTSLSLKLRAANTTDNTSLDELAAQIESAIGSAAQSARGTTTDAQRIKDLNTLMAAVSFPLANVDGVLVVGATGDLTISAANITTGTGVITLDNQPLQVHNASGQLLHDLTLTVRKAESSVQFTITVADTAAHASVDDLVALVSTRMATAVSNALAGSAPAAPVGFTGDWAATWAANLRDIQFAMAGLTITTTAGVLTPGVTTVGGQTITVAVPNLSLKNLAMDGRVLVDDFMTEPVYANDPDVTTAVTTPTASLTLSAIGVNTPTGITATGLNPATTISVGVSNMAQALAGQVAAASIAVVPPDGLGVLTPFKDLSWTAITDDLAALPALLGDTDAFGAYGELGRLIPLLGMDVADVFGLRARLDAVQARLDSVDSLGLVGLPGLLASALGVDATAITLSLDATGAAEALRIRAPMSVSIDTRVPIKILLNDAAFTALLSPADKARLEDLAGSVTRITDDDGTALMRLTGSFQMQLDLGIDLASASPNKGRVFLMDHAAAGAAGVNDDDGTWARFDLSASSGGMAFDSNQGIYQISIRGGTASVNQAGQWTLDSATAGVAERVYLNTTASLGSTALATFKQDNFDVVIDAGAQATASLPVYLTVSDDLGQLAMQEIPGFLNPLPLGTMDLNFKDLGLVYAKMGGATITVDGEVREANKPLRPASAGNGPGDSTPEGAPVDSADDTIEPTNLNPYVNSTDGSGATTDAALPGGDGVEPLDLFGDGSPNAAPGSGIELSYVLPDLGIWQDQLVAVLEKTLGTVASPEKPVNYALIFLLRDPTIIVDTVDKVLETIQKGLDAFSSVLDLPIIGDQLREATQFVADLRRNVVGAIRDALTSAVDVYGGLDNALRMFMFDILTVDPNNDYKVTASEINSNRFLNFIRDYNNDGVITPDDIVVEYIAGVGNPSIDARAADYLNMPNEGLTYYEKQYSASGEKLIDPLTGKQEVQEKVVQVPGVLPGQRTAWVTSGINTVVPGVTNPDGSDVYTITAGNIELDPLLKDIVDDIVGTISGTADALVDFISRLAEQLAEDGAPDSIEDLAELAVEAFLDGDPDFSYENIQRRLFGGAVGLVSMQNAAREFEPSDAALADLVTTMKANFATGSYDIPAVLVEEFKAAVYAKAQQIAKNMALQQSTAIQFRMNLGQTYTPNLDLSFDIGVPGLNLALDGGIQLDLGWDFYLGFGIDIKDGFYLITNMPGNAGIGQVTNLNPDGTVNDANPILNNVKDAHVANLWLVGKPGQTAAEKEIQFTIDVFLAPGSGGGPASLSAEFLVLNGTLTDNWDGWIKDNDTGIWGNGTHWLTGESMEANYGRTDELFRGKTGADGSRTQLHAEFSVDLKDRGLFGISALGAFTNGRLTFADMRATPLSDLVKVEWRAQAQVNLHLVLGISPGGQGFLPAIKGDFHLTWQGSNKSEVVKKIESFLASGYDSLFNTEMSAWFTDVYLDVGTFFTQFLRPIVDVINNITDPIMPVIDALTTPIPGLSDFMGRDYSAIDLASDMSALFGGVAKIDFIIAMIRLIDTLQNLPNTPGMLLPVSEVLILKGPLERRINLSALKLPIPDIPVPLPYKTLADVDYNQDGLEFALDVGVGWHQDTTVQEILSGDIPDFSVDIDLSADMAIPAPYETYTFELTVPELGNRIVKVVVGMGWKNLKVSDVLSGDFAPDFDISVYGPDFDLSILPPLRVKVPELRATVFGTAYSWRVKGADANGYLAVEWPSPLSDLVDPDLTPVTLVDLSSLSVQVSLGFDFDLPSIDPFMRRIEVNPMVVKWEALGQSYRWDLDALSAPVTGAAAAFNTAFALFIDEGLAATRIDLPVITLPPVTLFDLFPDFDFDFTLPGLPSLPNINIDLPDIDLPGQVTVTPQDAFNEFKEKLKKPGAKLRFPILEDPLGAVIDMLSGKPADLMIFTPPKLDVAVGFRLSFPIFPPLFGGLGGEIRLEAQLTLGYDTQGISDFFDSKRITDIFNGFWVGDHIVNGVDRPEIKLTTKLYAFAELNGGIIRGGVEGGIRMIGILDLYDENRDNKFRANEIIAAVSEDPLDVVYMSLKGTAYISAYLDIFGFIKWFRVFEYTFVDVTLFHWEHDPALNKPVLGSMDGSVLTLHMGNRVGAIDGNAAIDKGASDRIRRNTADANEQFTLTESGGLKVEALLPNGKTYSKTFSGVTQVRAYAGEGDDVIDASALSASVSVYFVAGPGTDVLKGGAGADTLVGSANGNATLIGGGGADRLIARGSTTRMEGGAGDDTYRFLPGWGNATVVDTSGANVLDFRAQTSAVTFDDAFHRVLQGSNLVTFTASDTIDRVRGGSGSDVLDFSGNAANLLVTVTGQNTGWVTFAASGMTQTGLAAGAAQSGVNDNAGFGFEFDGFENAVGGAGSDVFRMRHGASLSGYIHGHTTAGLHASNGATGGDAANARNTIDFSEYTSGVVVNLESRSVFGNVADIEVRGFHNVFGGFGNDTLIGDGRNNLIVGNAGVDTLEGKAAHDLLVADTFTTWRNELGSMPGGLGNVTDYLSLQTVGVAGGFGGTGSSAGRMWIWKGQALENKSLTPGKHTLKGGSGNDILLGSLGGDVFNIGGTGEGNDTIMGDLGRVVVDFASRAALSARTYEGGGADNIYLGSGSNLVLAGNGSDFIQGLDNATSTNIVLADNGQVQFKSALASVGGGKFSMTFTVQDGFTHMLDTVTTLLSETGGQDTVNLSNGSALVIGGGNDDTISFTAGNSTGKNFRFVAGDHASVSTDERGGVTVFESTDTVSGGGGADTISIGDKADTSARFLGINQVIGGMGDDTILVSAFIDPDTGEITHGRAQSTDIILADNGRIERYDSIAVDDTPNIVKLVLSTQTGLGGNDTVIVANGDKTIVGGFGADTITVAAYGADAETGTPQSNAIRLIAGDNARVDFDTAGAFTSFASLDTTITTGDRDVIRIGKVGSTIDLGQNYVIAGMGADDVFIAATVDEDTGQIIAGQATSEDIVLGDNGTITRTALTNHMLGIVSTQIDKGGDDRVLTGHGGKVMIGGFGSDLIRGVDGTMIVLGDSGALTYDTAAFNGVLRIVETTATAIGGNDTIQLGEGYKLVMGGFGLDTVQIDATSAGEAMGLALVTGLAAVSPSTPTENRGRTGRFVLGDNGRAQFDTKGGLTDLFTTDVISATGGADTITLGARDTTANLGYQVVMGGMNGDTITVRQGATSEDIIFGDNGELRRQQLGYGVLRVATLVADKGGEDTIRTGNGVKTVVGGFAGDVINIATTSAANTALILGDSGAITYDAGGGSILEKVESMEPGFGGNDTVVTGDGDVIFVGGYGADTLAVNSTTTSARVAVGDSATLLFGLDASLKPSLTALTTIDQTGATGDADSIRIGPSGGVTGSMGTAILVGGMGADALTVTGESASSVVIIGDNADLRRTAAGHMVSITSLLLDQGAGDVIDTVKGSSVIVGGTGGDTIRAGSGDGVVLGDSGSIVWDSTGNGVLRQVTSLGLTIGGIDNISLGTAGHSSDGDRIVVGGAGGDTINLLSVRGTGLFSEPRASSVVNPERIVLGDNGKIELDEWGRMTDVGTLDSDIASGGNDTIGIIMSGDALAPNRVTDFNLVAGGVGNDSISIIGATKSRDVIAGDNLDFRRTDGSATDPTQRYVWMFADVLLPANGGNDNIRTGSGDKLVLGGAGADTIETLTNGTADRNIVMGDAGSVVFDVARTGRISQIFSTGTGVGGNDNVKVGGGTSYAVLGMGNDTLTLNTGDSGNRVMVGDNGQIDFDVDNATNLPMLVQSTGDPGADAALTGDTFVLPATGRNVIIGGSGVDQLSGGSADTAKMPGSGTWTNQSTSAYNLIHSVTVLGEYLEFGMDDPAFVKVPTPEDEITGTITGEGTVSEDGTLSVIGKIGLPAVGGGPATFAPVTLQGTYGALSLVANGAWSYTLDNAQAGVQALKSGDVRGDTFLISTTDGGGTVISITILGADDAASVAGDQAGALTESGTPDISGVLTVTDADTGQAGFVASGAASAYGMFALAADGSWTYAMDNSAPAVRALAQGQTVQDVFAVTTIDGTLASVTITITGVNNAATFGGVASGAAVEDVTPVATGTLLVNDPDGGESAFQVSAQTGAYGSLELAADGQWTYTLDNDATHVQQLVAGQVVTDTFTVDSTDGSTTQITVTITGSADAAVVGGDTTGAVNETDALLASGALTVSDADAGEAVFQPVHIAGVYGQFSVDAAGNWQYQLLAAQANVQTLAGGQVVQEVFTVRTADGASTSITVTITGTNAPATFGGLSTGGATADTPVVSGQLSVVDGDAGEAGFQASAGAGTYGSLVFGADGRWTYTLDAAGTAYRALAGAQQASDVFDVLSTDGTVTQIVVTVTGINDAALISGTHTASVTEDGQLVAGGSLAVSDDDAGEASFIALQQAGVYGTLSLGSDGTWTYTLANSQANVQALGAADEVSDSFTVSTLDGTTAQVVVAVRGAAEASGGGGGGGGGEQPVPDIPSIAATLMDELNGGGEGGGEGEGEGDGEGGQGGRAGAADDGAAGGGSGSGAGNGQGGEGGQDGGDDVGITGLGRTGGPGGNGGGGGMGANGLGPLDNTPNVQRDEFQQDTLIDGMGGQGQDGQGGEGGRGGQGGQGGQGDLGEQNATRGRGTGPVQDNAVEQARIDAGWRIVLARDPQAVPPVMPAVPAQAVASGAPAQAAARMGSAVSGLGGETTLGAQPDTVTTGAVVAGAASAAIGALMASRPTRVRWDAAPAAPAHGTPNRSGK